MKKFAAILLILTLCLGLCACGTAESSVNKPEEVVLPTKPEALEAPTQPVTGDTQSAEAAESTEPTEETYPWEAEFNEEDYGVFQFPNQVSYRIGGLFGFEVRSTETYSDGLVIDWYYYPSGNVSHTYEYYPDGTFREKHCLDKSYVDENGVSYSGEAIYQKTVKPDGSWNEMYFDENRTITGYITMGTDGFYSETYYFENGNIRMDISDNPSTGEHWEDERYENGTTKRTVSSNSQTGTYYETEYFENGKEKHFKNETSESTIDVQYDEDGFHTYYHSKNANYEVELISDETGKLAKVVENGEVKEDPAIIAQYAQSYNFKQ